MAKDPAYVLRQATAVLTRGFDPQLSVGSARPPIFRSSTYVFSSPEAAERAFAVALGKVEPKEDEDVELIYCRLSHPNAEILEDQIVPLETGARSAACFNSGLSAISTLFFTFCKPGDSFVHTTPLYGGTHHLLTEIIEPLGPKGIPVPAGNTTALRKAIQQADNLRFIFIETPANPTLTMTDISAAVDAARNHPSKPLVVVDNTLMGPAFQQPLALGADMVIYSATKYLAGFSDMLGGVILARDLKSIEQLKGIRALLGNILQPDQSWLLNSRLPTVMLRMNRQSKNAQRIAEGLANHSKIEKLYYPSLFTDPEQKRIRDAQCPFPGAMMALDIKGGKRAAFDFLRNLKIMKSAVSLGAMESLVCHPLTTTHSEMSEEQQREDGISDKMVRVSVGIEDWRDLLADCEQALKMV